MCALPSLIEQMAAPKMSNPIPTRLTKFPFPKNKLTTPRNPVEATTTLFMPNRRKEITSLTVSKIPTRAKTPKRRPKTRSFRISQAANHLRSKGGYDVAGLDAGSKDYEKCEEEPHDDGCAESFPRRFFIPNIKSGTKLRLAKKTAPTALSTNPKQKTNYCPPFSRKYNSIF